MNTLFHLAFPLHDFTLAKNFYHDKLGFNIGRESEHAIIFQFAEHQIVGHKIDTPLPEQQSIYPRHFGLIFLEFEEFEQFIQRIEAQKINFKIPLKIRFANSPLEHHSFFLQDPSNNLLEFKYYSNYSAIFGEKEFRDIGES